ncbi:MAG: hypothetical protein FWD43_01535 [Coriobacteriia bacterium]|nr:hypothetical protein [Coriobacteriia bacterium]
MKKLLVLSIAILLAVLLVGCNGNTMSSFWTLSTGVKSNLQDTSWGMTAKTVNGHATRNIYMPQESLDALYVDNTNSEGKVTVVLLGPEERSFDVSGSFHKKLDTSGLEPGWYTVRLDCEGVKNWDLLIKW